MTNDCTTNLQELFNAGINKSAVERLVKSYRKMVEETGDDRLLIFAWNGVRISLDPCDLVKETKARETACLPLPSLPDVYWEKNAKGGFEAWHLPPGDTRRAKREKKTYLGYIGKRKLAVLTNQQDLESIIVQWIAERRKLKGIASL